MKNVKMMRSRRLKASVISLIMAVILMMIFMLSACGAEANTNNYYDLKVVDATSDFYVNDFAGVLSKEQKSELMENAVSLDEEYSGIQVVITTVNSFEDAVVSEDVNISRVTIENLAYSMYNQYGIGQDDMGILILVSIGEREVKIETGRQMQYYITDGLSGELLDTYAIEYFAENQFGEGLVSLQNGVIQEIKEQVSIDWNSDSKTLEESQAFAENTTPGVENGIVADGIKDNSNESTSDNGLMVAIFGLFGSIAAAIAAFIAWLKQKSKRNAERKELEDAKNAEINYLKKMYKADIASLNGLHEQNVATLKRDYQRLLSEKDADIEKLQEALNNANTQLSTLTSNFEIINGKYSRVQQLYPDHDFEQEIYEMVEAEYKVEAKKVDTDIAKAISTEPTKDNAEIFAEALELYDSVSSDVRKYVTSNRDDITLLYSKAITLKEEFERAEQEKRDKAVAQSTYESIKETCNRVHEGTYKTYDALNSALRMYLALSVAQKGFFPDNELIESLKMTHREAKKDYNHYTAANNAECEVKSVVERIRSADEDDRDRLARAKRCYDNLNEREKAYFSRELLNNLNRLINDANEDHRRKERRRKEEEEERRRRMQSSSSHRSYSSSSHRSSFGGHGGRSGGGGASRRF